MGRIGGACRPRYLACLSIAVAALTTFASPAHAGTAAGSTETLQLSASGERGIGKELAITAEGQADGAHRVFVYGEASGCAGSPGNQSAVNLTPPEGEQLPAGHFTRTFDVVPTHGTVYGVCAFLDTTVSALPDAWTSGCFALDAGPDCRLPELDPSGVLAAEEEGRKVVKEEEQQRAEREARERAAAEEAATRYAEEAARQKALAAARCHVPKVLGHTLKVAKTILQRAHCRLGRVTVRKGAKGQRRVVWQKPGKGGIYPPGERVALALGSRR